MEPKSSLLHSQVPVWIFRNNIGFYGEYLLATYPNPKPEDHPLSAVRDCLFNTLHTGGRSSIHNLSRRRAVETGTHLLIHL